MSGPPPPRGDDPLIGEDIGAYTVLSKLGEGGMATVFLAQHRTIGRKMAVKVLRREFALQSEWGERFVTEAQAVAAVKHRNIVEVFDFGQLADGRQFLMMEFVEGESLERHLVEHGPLLPSIALGFAEQILNALGEAHKKGIVHRDLKPGNVIVTREHNHETHLKVLDFGLARMGPTVLEGDGADLYASLIAGTPAYIAPEQALGKVVDGRADLYALGVMLFEMLTGRLPFVSKSQAELITMHLSHAPPRVDSVEPQVNAAVTDFIDSLLAKDPADRPENADVARRSVQRLIRQLHEGQTQIGRAATLRAPPPPVSSVPDFRVGPSRWVIAGAVLVVAVLGFAVWKVSEPATVIEPEVAAPLPVPVPAKPVVKILPQPEPEPAPQPVPIPVRKRPRPPACHFDDQFRDYARRTREELRTLTGGGDRAFATASDTLSSALAAKDCVKANAALTRLKSIAGVKDD